MGATLTNSMEDVMAKGYRHLLVAGLSLAFVTFLVAADANAGTIGQGSCPNPNDCSNNSGRIGSDSCNGNGACTNNSIGTFIGSGKILDNSCNGVGACTNNSGRIGYDACNENYACTNNSGRIGNDACNHDPGNRCDNNTGSIPADKYSD